jgi:hypothetical protein
LARERPALSNDLQMLPVTTGVVAWYGKSFSDPSEVFLGFLPDGAEIEVPGCWKRHVMVDKEEATRSV